MSEDAVGESADPQLAAARTELALLSGRARRKRLSLGIFVLVLIAVVVAGAWFHFAGLNEERTDDAFIASSVYQISPATAGRLKSVPVGDNEVVQAGQLLAELDATEQQAGVDRARAALAVAQAQLQEAVATSAAAASAAELGAATSAPAAASEHGAPASAPATATKGDPPRADAASAQVKRWEAQVAQDQAELRQAELVLASAKIVAPVAGRVTNRSAQPTEFVKEGRLLMSLVATDAWVIANFKETQLADMRPGQKATIHVDAYDADLPAHVDSIQAGSGAQFSLLPPQNATGNYVKVVQRVPVKLVFDDAGVAQRYLLGPGMSVEPRVFTR